jgi:hypothetical protein
MNESPSKHLRITLAQFHFPVGAAAANTLRENRNRSISLNVAYAHASAT